MDGSVPQTTAFTARLGAWIAETPRRWPEPASREASRAILDTVACMIAGAHDEATERVLAGIGGWGRGGGATVVARAGGVDAPWAALVNGTAAHALDYDDVLDPAGAHVSAVLVPGLLALAEEVDASGVALVDAYIVGFEFMECLAEAVNMEHYARGWHTTLTLGSPAVAAACARLLRLDAEAARNAISIATSLSGGFKRQFGTNTKPLHAGLAAKNGILAARMAAAGLTAGADAYEGVRGFGALYAGDAAPGFAAGMQRLGGTPAIVDPGVWLKPYPCCASTHRAIDALLHLRAAHGLTPDNVAAVEARVSEIATRNLMYTTAENEMQARFSMPYCLSAALIEGAVRLGVFRRAAIGRADIAAVMPRIRMTVDPEQPASMPSTVSSWATVEFTTTDGRTLSHRVTHPKGYPAAPLTVDDLAEKFRDCAAGALADATAAALLPQLQDVAAVAKVRPLMAALAG